MTFQIDLPQEEIARFCERNRIRKLSLFGSVLHDDFRADSDIDVLVEFEPGVRIGLAFFDLEAELSEIIGRQVDLNTVEDLSQYFVKKVLRMAEVVYERHK